MGQARYQVRIYSPTTGLLTGVLTNWRSLNLERHLNSASNMILSLEEQDPHVALFEVDAILEVWRRLDRPNAEWYIEATLFHRTPQNDFTEDQRRIFISYSRGLNDLLHRRTILYAAKTAYTLKTGPGETVMKEFVDENVGPGASNVLRKSTGTWNPVTLGFSIADDKGLGGTWAGSRAWKNVLDVLNEISIKSGVDFSVERIGPREFEFRTYYPQFGIDHTTPGHLTEVMFSPELGNMINITYVKSRTEEVNAIVALGQGEDTARILWPQIDIPGVIASPWNVCEGTRDARNEPTLTELQTTATEALRELSAQENFSFDVLQTSARQYGVGAEYWFGDIVRAKYGDIETVRKITGVTINVSEGKEEVHPELSEYPATQGT